MMIVTDTASDIFEDEAAFMGVELVPLDIMLGQSHFIRNTPAEFDRFYNALKGGADFPTTSQPAPELYRALYEQAKQRNEDVLVIALSGELSGTVESARMAAELSDWKDRVYVMDSRHAITSQRLLVEEAVRLREQDLPAEQIISRLQEYGRRIRICGVLDSLEYLRRGGRIPAALAVVGDILSIKPVVAVQEGKLTSFGKARGMKAGQKFLRKEFERLERDVRWKVCFLYSQGRKLVDEFANDFMSRYGIADEDARFVQIGPVIGAHLGPDCVGLAFVATGPVD